MSWVPSEHSDQDNLQWCWLRAVEWGKWPSFVSQPIAPVLLIFAPWYLVIMGIVLANYMWATVRCRFVSAHWAYNAALFVRLKWLACPLAAWMIFSKGHRVLAAVALLWPAVTLVLLLLGPTTQIGKIQNVFMNQLGYQKQ